VKEPAKFALREYLRTPRFSPIGLLVANRSMGSKMPRVPSFTGTDKTMLRPVPFLLGSIISLNACEARSSLDKLATLGSVSANGGSMSAGGASSSRLVATVVTGWYIVWHQ
jgi:hypothetical protein